MYPISVCMIVKNEEDTLHKSLPALRPFVQDIHVVDTGSSDNTKQVAASLGAIVHDFTWVDDFSAARNFSLAQATATHLLVCDADEVFDASTAPALEAYLQASDDRMAGNVLIQNSTAENDQSLTIRLPRIFPNRPEFRYTRRIHEQLRFENDYPATIDTGILFHHFGYVAEAMQQQDKIQRNLQLLFVEHREKPHDPYVLFQIAKTYYVDKQYEFACQYYQQTIDILSGMQGISPAFLPSLLVQYAYSLLHLKQFGALFQVLGTAVDLYPDFTHLYFLYGQALIKLNDLSRLQEVRQAFEYCLHLGETNKYETVRGVGSFMAHYNLGVFYEVSGDLTQATSYYTLAAQAGYTPAITRLKQVK